MADDRASILNAMNGNTQSNNGSMDYLKSIDDSLKQLLKYGGSMSQSQVSQQFGKDIDSMFKNRSSMKRAYKDAQSQFIEAFQSTMLDSIVDSNFKKSIQTSLDNFAKSIGVDLADVPAELGKELSRQAMEAIRKNPFGDAVVSHMQDLVQGSISKAKSAYNRSIEKDLAVGVGTATTSLSAATSGIVSAIGALAPEILALVGVVSVAVGAFELLKPAIKGTKKLFDGMRTAGNRYYTSREKQVELAQKRAIADMESMITEPFKILKESADAVYQAWDQNIRIINATQGYNKSDLQDLLGSFADRLRSEGLSSVISGVDITESLANVLKSGLSGKVAEEFAYTATKLNAAIPTQDFFGYADTYASLIANATNKGMSQAAAIDYANQQLEMFASDILFASRQLSGGFSTGLKDAESLFRESVKIAQASKYGTPSQIGGVLTSVAAVTGAIAPDLATAMTDAVVKAATGGNSPEIVALRSLAGVNASNTEFLQMMAKNPQQLFTNIFSKLADMQNMAPGAYMEVAEGLASVFGIPMDAFARIDFNQLASAVSNMNVNTASLNENMDLLASGQTTTNAEQLKMRQINQYLIDEGLSYVMDNEVARSIQEHMWDEQMNQDLIEATYAVDLHGAALEFIEGMKHTIDNIFRILTPTGWFQKLQDVKATSEELKAQDADKRSLLELGKVGAGNAQALHQLLTRGKNLHITPDILSLMGGTSAYQLHKNMSEARHIQGNIATGQWSNRISVEDAVGMMNAVTSRLSRNGGPTSKYQWGSIGKTANQFLYSVHGGQPVGNVSPINTSSSTVQSAIQSKLTKMLSEEYMMNFAKEGKSYSEWVASSRKFGISKFSDTLKDLGYNEADVKARYQSAQVNAAAQLESERKKKEEDFWTNTQDYELQVLDLFKLNNDTLDNIYKKHTDFYNAWVDYFVKHTVYSASYTHAAVTAVQQQERKGSQDAIYALAEALTKNTVDLLDPTVQTNAILSQILIVANAILQQNNTANKSVGLPDTLNALALGLT